MAHGLVSVASAVTVNNQIIHDGVNGFLVNNESDWYNELQSVIAKRNSFADIGKAATDHAQRYYSYDANAHALGNFIGVKEAGLPDFVSPPTRQAIK
jgi:hypothetical protein